MRKHDTDCVVDMYHSKTLKKIQDRIHEDMKDAKGNIRVVICTNAAGMGVNFAEVNSVINYGPQTDVDAFIQQIGRGGCDEFQKHLS